MTPSELYLLNNVELDSDYNYTIDFENEQAQQNYFNSKISNVLDINEDYSYIRDNEAVKVYKHIDLLFGVNYLMYKNNGKWYYAFITKKEYVNADCTAITFKIDPLQTYMFDYTIEESFIEREHQDRFTKTAGAILEPLYNRETENIEKGDEYFNVERTKINDNIPAEFDIALGGQADNKFQMYWVTIVATETLSSKSIDTLLGVMPSQPSDSHTTMNKGMPTNTITYVAPLPLLIGSWTPHKFWCALKENSRVKVWCLDLSQLKSLSENPKVISINISRYCPFTYNVVKGKETGTIKYTTYQIIPEQESDLVSDLILTSLSNDDNGYYGAMFFVSEITARTPPILEIPFSTLRDLNNLSINNLKSIDFEPKLETKDFKYIELEVGQQKIKLNIEDCPSNSLYLEYINSYSIRNSVALLPLNYKGVMRDYRAMITYDSITNEIPLRTDAWRQYLSQNKSSMVSGFVTSALQTAGSIGLGLATGGIGFAVAGVQALNFAGNIANKVAQINDIKNTPDKMQKTALDIVLDQVTRGLYITKNVYEIQEQFKHKCFEYFYHYGYKCNDFKKPNTKSRYYFNYLKTIGANIKTNIDAQVKNELQTIYDNGITIWHYRGKETFKGVNNYEYENVEINLIEEVSNG